MQTDPDLGAAARPASEDAHEFDVWWGAYAGRAMVPTLILCVLITGTLVVSARWLAEAAGAPAAVARYVIDGLIVLIWLVQLGVWGLRLTAYNYRLTTHRLLCMKSFFHPLDQGVPLANIGQVVVQRSWTDRRLGLGQVRILLADGKTAMVLMGVRDPDHIALEIRSRAQRAKT